MHVVIRGLHSAKSTKGRGTFLSSYYFRQDHYDPFTGGKKAVGKLAAPFYEREHVEKSASEAAAAWRRWFVHDKIMIGLRVNRLLAGHEVHVDVHYGFLSGFAHPSKRGYEAVYGRNYPGNMGQFDHYASEIGLLYAITIAAAEVEAYGRMARQPPTVGLKGWEEATVAVREAPHRVVLFLVPWRWPDDARSHRHGPHAARRPAAQSGPAGGRPCPTSRRQDQVLQRPYGAPSEAPLLIPGVHDRPRVPLGV
jgi:hypothetical protein